MRFLGLGLWDRVPDAKTVWLYRDALAQAGKVEELFGLFDHCPTGDACIADRGHLARQGYIARGGQILGLHRAGAAQPQHARRKHCHQEGRSA
jgi:hypothetical protein